MTRKEFLALVAAGSAAPPLTGETQAAPVPDLSSLFTSAVLTLSPAQAGPPYLMAGPMLGHAGPAEARVWIRATASVPWSVRISESPAMDGAREVAGPALSDDSAGTGVAILDGLKPATRYYYQVL